MGDYSISFVLGVVEGVTEFIPVSSTAHLRLMEALLHHNLSDQVWGMFFIVIRLGALSALMLLYAQQLNTESRTSPHRFSERRGLIVHSPVLVGWAFAASVVPTYSVLLVVNRGAATLNKIGVSLLVGGVAMWLVDLVVAKRPAKAQERATLGQAIWIGLCQPISAAFPGTSRSMITMIAGELGGLSRGAAVEFSLLLFAPSVLAASFVAMFEISWRSSSILLVVDLHAFAILGIGFCSAAVMAYLSMDWMLKWVERHGLTIFGVYRVCLGLALLGRAVRLPH